MILAIGDADVSKSAELTGPTELSLHLICAIVTVTPYFPFTVTTVVCHAGNKVSGI